MNSAPVTRQRLVFAAALAVTIPLGLASRRFAASLPPFVAEYAGDTLWALAMYLAVSIAAPRLGIRARAVIALATSCLVELSQLYHAPWIDDIRATTLGALLLERGSCGRTSCATRLASRSAWLASVACSAQREARDESACDPHLHRPLRPARVA